MSDTPELEGNSMAGWTETPRTDAQPLWHGEPAVNIDFARQLERELAEKEAENAALREGCEAARNALILCRDSLLTRGVSTDPLHPDRIALDHAERIIDEARRGE